MTQPLAATIRLSEKIPNGKETVRKKREGGGKKQWRRRNYSVLTKLRKVEFH